MVGYVEHTTSSARRRRHEEFEMKADFFFFQGNPHQLRDSERMDVSPLSSEGQS